jgi:glycosyltransferase involved in cell wall biosynthesis
MKLSVVIPTRGDQNMKNSIECLQRQTLKDFEVIFVVDRIVTRDEERGTRGNIRYITNTNSDFVPQKNASYNRNFGINQAKGEYIQLMDDDERLEDDYLENSLALRDEYHKKLQKDFVLTPTLMYRKTGHIQNQ